jgi:hypothetical protein
MWNISIQHFYEIDYTRPHFMHTQIWYIYYCILLMVCRCVFCFCQTESPLPELITQFSAPNCIVSHLTYIQFKGYQGFPDELSFAEYILQNGLVLKKMIITDISVDILKYNILRRLSNVPRASRLCQLTFEWAVSP